MKLFARISTVAVVLFVNACSNDSTLDTADADPTLLTKDSAASSCTAGDKSIITTSQTVLTTCTTLESTSTTAFNALLADLQACVKAQVDARACNVTDIQKQVALLATIAPTLKTTACEGVTTLGKMTASKTATLKTDATNDFTTTCTYATDLVSIETQLAAIFTSAADAGTSDSGIPDGGAIGSYSAQLQAILKLAQDAYALQQQLPALNATVQADIDAAKTTCGI